MGDLELHHGLPDPDGVSGLQPRNAYLHAVVVRAVGGAQVAQEDHLPAKDLDHCVAARDLGIGCDAAEPPFIGTDRPLEVEDETPLLPGMAIVFEPLIWQDGVGGYRSEEMIVITETGYERLSSHDYAPFETETP